MKTLSRTHPDLDLRKSSPGDPGVSLRRVLDFLGTLRGHIAEVVNFNSISYVSQNGEPTLEAGEMMLWKDADAGSGDSTYFLLYNDAGTVIRFSSDEVAP